MATKMVIVVRKDLHMRKGKMIAQGAHAAVGMAVELALEKAAEGQFVTSKGTDYFVNWMDTGQKKIVVGCNSESELLEIYAKAGESKINSNLITDAGSTEFHGVPTKTCVAIGPWDEEEIDKITIHLKLL